MSFQVTEQLPRRAADNVAWLSTVTPSGKPVPRPVWFAFDGRSFLMFSQPTAAKVRHIRTNPNVTLHFNSGPSGEDVLVVVGTAAVLDDGIMPSTAPGYLEKYERHYPAVGLDRGSFDAEYSSAIRITPERAWGWG